MEEGRRTGIDLCRSPLYHLHMGYSLDIHDHSDGYLVSLAVVLSRQESNDLFLSGDSMISWPTDGLLGGEESLLSRTGIFASEVAARRTGLTLQYATREQAEKTAALLGLQLDRIGITRED